ncbi:MAG: CHASE3 domain-containing protein [Thainema sp.]
MQQKYKLGKIVQFGFGSIFIVIAGVGIISKLTTNHLIESSQWVDHTHRAISLINSVEEALVDAETGQRGFIITNQDSFLQPYDAAKARIDGVFVDLRQRLSINPTQLEYIDQLEELSDAKFDEIATTIQLKRSGQEEELMALISSGQGQEIMDEIRQLTDEMLAIEEELLAEREADNAAAANLASIVSIGGVSLVLLMGLGVLFFINRQVIRPINQVATDLATSSNELAATVQQQEQAASQQASSVTQTSSTMEELGISSRQSAEQAEIASGSARQVLQLVESGNKAVEQSLDSMMLLTQKVQTVAEQIAHFSDQTSQIGNISALVSDLANQTNMLALNAAVEAVRAGEHGKGFAVVAAEIRKLADQSRVSAEKINILVNDIQSALTAAVLATDDSTQTAQIGSEISHQTADVFQRVSDAVNTIVNNVQQISLSSKQQSTAISQVVDVMTALDLAAKDTASSISQTRINTQQLNKSAHDLQAVV